MEIFSTYLCGYILPFLLITIGLFFGIKYKFFYIIHPIKTIKTIIKNQKGGFRSLSVALAGTLGVGNIIGVASAICAGGYGAVFWMWISAFCAMSLKYAEVYLAVKYKKERNGAYVGGAPYYIFYGLNKRLGTRIAFVLSLTFAVLCVINSLTTGNLVQINAVSSLLPISPMLFGIIFTVLVVIVISGGTKRISGFNSFLIPALSIFYIVLCLGAIFSNISLIPSAFNTIIKDAFSPISMTSGVMGFGISRAIRYGVSRGVLSNEAGCGTSPCAHASSDGTMPHGQGCLGIFEVFVDTILLCTLTALVIIISKVPINTSAMALVLGAFDFFFGSFGTYAVIISSILFAFATVCTQYFYGKESISYFTSSKAIKAIFFIAFIAVLIIGAIIPMSIMWQISDITLAIMTIFNLFCLIALFKQARE